MGIVETIALSMGAAWASGINLYAALLTLGLLGATESIVLPAGLEVLTNPAVIMAAGFMYFVEFFADKVPGVDTGWDAIHSFIRIPAGAALAAGAIGDVSPVAELVAIILGGGLAATSHFSKAGARVLINASPEPFSNWTASVAEDAAVIVGLWTALYQPELFVALLLMFLVLAIWLLPRVWRGIKALYAAIARRLGGSGPPAAPAGRTSDPRFELTLGRNGGRNGA